MLFLVFYYFLFFVNSFSKKAVLRKVEYEKKLDYDIKLCSTSIGPHKDDIEFYLGDKNLKFYGSQGQQRVAVLALKLSEIEIFKKYKETTPILLLDDVLSELDKHRQNYLLDSICDVQTLITCTGVDDFVNHRFSINKMFHVEKGNVTKEN